MKGKTRVKMDWVIRKKLRLRTRKKNAANVLGENQKEKLERLFRKYDL